MPQPLSTRNHSSVCWRSPYCVYF
uniref:Uncharacterized protein n=1 Tax=Arundo donax TaxID=35708 RepID=A0A0A8ZAG2_ARUDO